MASLDAPGRLARLGAALVSTEPDAELQKIVVQAASLATAPIALVSLVMGHVQFFRASHGLPIELQVTCATSREDSFCQFVVQEEQTFIVLDADHDPRLPPALVRGFAIQSYLGTPIRLEGEILGSLCVIDSQPRSFDEPTIAALKVLAEQVSRRLAELSLRRTNRPPPPTSEPPEGLWGRLDFHVALVDATLDELIPLLDKGREYGRFISPAHGPRLRAMLREATGLWPLLRSAVGEILQVAEQLGRPQQGSPGAPHLIAAARTAERALIEVSPLVRLGEAVLTQQIDLKVAARAGSVLSEALLFHRTMKASLRELRAAVDGAKSGPSTSQGAA